MLVLVQVLLRYALEPAPGVRARFHRDIPTRPTRRSGRATGWPGRPRASFGCPMPGGRPTPMRRASILIACSCRPRPAGGGGSPTRATSPTASRPRRSLRDVAKQCASYSPRAEARLHRAEALVLGARARRRARPRARRESRREACTPSGKVRPSLRRARAARRRRPSAARRWGRRRRGPVERPDPLPGIIAIHSTLMPNGKILFFYNNPVVRRRGRSRKVMVWDPVTKTGVRRDVPVEHLVRRPDPAGRRPRARGRGQPPVPDRPGPPAAFKGLNEIWLFDPVTETWTQGPNMRHGRWYPTATRLADGRVLITAGWDESGGGASANNRDIEVYTPAADGRGPGHGPARGIRGPRLLPAPVPAPRRARDHRRRRASTTPTTSTAGPSFGLSHAPRPEAWTASAASAPGCCCPGRPRARAKVHADRRRRTRRRATRRPRRPRPPRARRRPAGRDWQLAGVDARQPRATSTA